MIITELFKLPFKSITWDKGLNIYTNGEGNDYPERMERFRNKSITALLASGKMTQFCIGKGFGDDIDKIKIGKDMLIDIAEDVVSSIVDDRGVFIWVKWNANFEINSFEVIPFKQCRLGKKDDKKYHGKVLIYPDWNGKIIKDNIVVVDSFNPDKSVIEEQVKKAGDWRSYKGQVLYYNMDRKYIYPLSRIHAVDLECDNEALASTYKNRTLRFGFFGKTVIITRPLVKKGLELDISKIGQTIYRKAVSEKEKFVENFKKFIGSEEYGGGMHFEVDFAGEKLEDAIVFKNIESNIKADLFALTENSASDKILWAYNGLPAALVKSNDNALFGQSGVGLKQLEISYQKNTTKDRDAAERVLNRIWDKVDPNFKLAGAEKAKVDKLSIIKLIDEPVTPIPNEQP